MSVHKFPFHLAKLKRFLVQKVHSNLGYCFFERSGPFQRADTKVKGGRGWDGELGLFWLIEGLEKSPPGVAETLFDSFSFSVVLSCPVPVVEQSEAGGSCGSRFGAGGNSRAFSCSLQTSAVLYTTALGKTAMRVIRMLRESNGFWCVEILTREF